MSSGSGSGSRRRKLQMSMWKEQGHYRRSPRISALDAWKSQKPNDPIPLSILPPPPPLQLQAAMVHDPDPDNTFHGHPQGPASRTRGRKKRKLRPLEDVTVTSLSSKPKKNGKQLCLEDDKTDNDVAQEKDSPEKDGYDELAIVPSVSEMPEKRILELILDVLQRRDSHEIFAQPVDPEEVEDYYKIIKEPMDFGTMRAKLHEGMYTSLQQFECDVFLISRNAMHFNSSTTVYFRQARAIHELAKRVFHVLKYDPVKFESEFSETRRRTCRRTTQSETGGPSHSPCSKLATNTRPTSLVVGVAAKTPPGSWRRSSNFRRRIQVNPGSSTAKACTDAKEVLSGTGDGRRSDFLEEDRRSTYRPWTSFLDENNSVMSTVCGFPKRLMHVNGQDIGYRESLMMFVKDLGPAVQMIAKRKLLRGLSADPSSVAPSLNSRVEAPKCQIPAASTSIKLGRTTMDTVINAPISQNLPNYFHECPTVLQNSRDGDGFDLSGADERKKAYVSYQMGMFGGLGEVSHKNNRNYIHSAFGAEVLTSDGMNIVGVSGGEPVHQERSTGMQLGSHFSITGGRDTSTTMILDKGKLDNKVCLLGSASGHSQSRALECRLGEDHSFSSSSWPTDMSRFGKTKGSMHNVSSQCLIGNNQEIAAEARGVGSLPEAGQAMTQQASSSFIFDLPFLRTRLEQINPIGRDRFSEQGSSSEGPFLNKKSYQRTLTCTRQAELSTQPYSDNQQLDNQHTDLALQL